MHAFYDKVTDRARKALSKANDFAKENGDPLVTRLHVLYGILAEDQNVGASVLKALGVNTKTMQDDIRQTLGKGKYSTHSVGVPYSQSVGRLICMAIDIGLPAKFIACQHLLRAILMSATDPAAIMLRKANITLELVDAQIAASVKPITT
jgi:ATP-dependent Clp protease ATP-binding subunit ClpC